MQEKWLEHWNHESPEIRTYLIQGAIFEIINGMFFAIPIFATEAAELECEMRKFEVQLERSAESINPHLLPPGGFC